MNRARNIKRVREIEVSNRLNPQPQGIKKWAFLILFAVFGAVYLFGVDKGQIYEQYNRKLAGNWENMREMLAEGSFGEMTVVASGGVYEETCAAVPENAVDLSAKGVGKGENSRAWEPAAGEAADGLTGEDIQMADVQAASEDTANEVVYETVEDSYFEDALFIGDSRTVGMYEYGGLEDTADFYAAKGLTVYRLFDTPVVEVPGQKKKATIEEMLSEKQFAKIYLMVGINEMGTGTADTFLEAYGEAVERLKELQPDAIIYLQGIIKVTKERSEKGDYIYNEGIEIRNEGLARLADNESVFYLDVNPLICDETGGMNSSYTFDGVHLKAQYIPIWKDFLKSHAVKGTDQ